MRSLGITGLADDSANGYMPKQKEQLLTNHMRLGHPITAPQVIVLQEMEILLPELSAAEADALFCYSKLLTANKFELVWHGAQPSSSEKPVICLHVGLPLRPMEDLLRVICIASKDLQELPTFTPPVLCRFIPVLVGS